MGAVLAASDETARVLVELGVVTLLLAMMARLASRLSLTAVPFYLLAGFAVGEGGLLTVDVGEEFIALTAEIGVLLLLTLGLEYSDAELRRGLREGGVPGAVDAVVNFTPGFAAGLLLGWDLEAAVLLGGVTWISSSGVISKVLTDLGRLGNRETPAVLNLLVLEDLAMAAYLPVVAAMVTGRDAAATVLSVAVALAAVAVILSIAVRRGLHISHHLSKGSDESLILAVFGLTLLVAGVAQRLQVSSAIGAFLVGLALSGPVQERAASLISPLRDLFAGAFFVFFAFQIRPAEVVDVLLPALGLAIVTSLGKLVTGWVAAARIGAGMPGLVRAGTALIARGEFSIIIAALGADTADGAELGALAAAYVLITVILGPLSARYAHLIPIPARNLAPSPAAPPATSS